MVSVPDTYELLEPSYPSVYILSISYPIYLSIYLDGYGYRYHSSLHKVHIKTKAKKNTILCIIAHLIILLIC